ncbi:MAG: hypothetical protein IPP25_13845 [Saprospiraceae bacterium]|nr:hypothetical protein [Candidatus Opimibacter skivensis]
MKKKFIGLILSFVILLVTGCKSNDVRLHETMQKSIAWLWHQQSPDGGWHSQTHAVLKDGKALTPYILYHLLQIPEDEFNRPEGGVQRGVEFIQREIRASMTMSEDSLPMLNYPNYSAAYALKVLCFLQQDTALQNILVGHLLREQFIEHRGITPDNLAYGGWGYGEPGLRHGEHGHVDVSHTRRIIEALTMKAKAEAKAKETPTVSRSHALTLSRFFLQGVQRTPEDSRLYEGCLSRKDLPYDGGFISSTVTLATNKCEPVLLAGVGHHYPSYATATCDGFLALHALGMTDTKAYADAKNWLEKNQDMSTIEGLSKDDPEQWHEVMHYYHWAVRAEAMTAAEINGPWSKELERMLIKEQHPDGYYINPIGGVNKEDDPLMATIFAIQAGIEVKSEE